MVGILFAAMLCMTAGCGASQHDGQDSVDAESEVSAEIVSAKGSEISEDEECPKTSGSAGPGTGEETEYQPTSESAEPPEPTMPSESPEQEIVEETGCPTEEEIAALGIREDMLAYWLVLNNKKSFVSLNEDGQSFFRDQYFWFLDCVEKYNQIDKLMVLDMDGDGREEVVLE